ncbi:hypothetical protein SBY92_003093 [Candida maltosa Xu316]
MLRKQFIYTRRHLFQKYTNPPRSSYIANKTYPLLIWNNLIPQSVKLTAVIGTGILSFINLHPKYYITFGPPLGIASYFSYIKYRKSQYTCAINRLDISKWNESELIRILKYDESSIENVLMDVNNTYDSIRSQVVKLIEKRIIEYISRNGTDGVTKVFVSENDQFNVNVPELEIESWMSSNVKLEGYHDELFSFIKFSVPYYDGKNVETRKRIGVISVFLMEVPPKEEENAKYTDMKIGIEITPLSWFHGSRSLFFTEIEGNGIMESDVYRQNK